MRYSGDLMFKCRLCGETFSDYHVPNISIATSSLVAGLPFPSSWGGHIVSLTEVHYHSNGDAGIADFVGAVKDIKEENV